MVVSEVIERLEKPAVRAFMIAAGRWWVDVSGSPARLNLHLPDEIVRAWLIGMRSAGSDPAELGLGQPNGVQQNGEFACHGDFGSL